MKAQATTLGLARRMSSALIVAIGIAIAWGMIVAWSGTIVSNWLPSDAYRPPYENITVTRSGSVVIASHAADNYQEITYRTLDGQHVEIDKNDYLQPAGLSPPEKPLRFVSFPLGWGSSWGASDFDRPRGSWYLVSDSRQIGRAYFVGYDQFSKLLIGYLGRQGFRGSLPPIDEWFETGPSTGYRTSAASVQGLSRNAPADRYSAELYMNNVPLWLVFVIDGDRLMEVDLRARQVREIFQAPQLVSVGTLTEAAPDRADNEPDGDGRKTLTRVALRTPDHMFVLDPATGAKREFPLPESLGEQILSVYSIGDDQLLLQWSSRDEIAGESQHLIWLSADGAIQREKTVQLAQNAVYRRADPRRESILISGMAPIPLGWAAVVGVIAPLNAMNDYSEPTYSAAVSKLLGDYWPGLLIVTFVGSLSAYLVWRWQRRYFRAATGAWCTFAFLLGLPGAVAYWLEMSRAKLEPCAECRSVVPRDRETCAACDTRFASPPPVGTEIFA